MDTLANDRCQAEQLAQDNHQINPAAKAFEQGGHGELVVAPNQHIAEVVDAGFVFLRELQVLANRLIEDARYESCVQ